MRRMLYVLLALFFLFALTITAGEARTAQEYPPAQPTEAPEAAQQPTATPQPEAMAAPNVTVQDQELDAEDTVTVSSVMAAENGWIVIHADEDGSPGPVIGNAAVEAGENTDVTVEIDPQEATATLYAMLHADTGQERVYEFPDGDAPVQDEQGNIVVQPFAVTGLPEAQVNTVEVQLVEYEIQMPAELPAGQTEFAVTNSGSLPHNFQIDGQGIGDVFETNLAPGETRTMQVDLEPGTYDIWCPVDGHRGLGMELTLTVTGEEAAAEAETTEEAAETEAETEAAETEAAEEAAPTYQDAAATDGAADDQATATYRPRGMRDRYQGPRYQQPRFRAHRAFPHRRQFAPPHTQSFCPRPDPGFKFDAHNFSRQPGPRGASLHSD